MNTKWMKSQAFRKITHMMGSAAAVLGIGFVGIRIWDNSHSNSFPAITPLMVAMLLLLMVTYTIACQLHPLAWKCVLAQLGVRVPETWAIKAYGKTQLAKYLPGNVFHLAGRQVAGMSAGIPSAAVAKSIGVEMTMLIVSGGCFTVLLIPIVAPIVTPLVSLILFPCLATSVYLVIRSFVGINLSTSFLLQIVFHLCSSLTFATVYLMLGGRVSDLNFVAAAYVIAWLIGTITPGAPAGVGIRELVLIFILGRHMEQAQLISAVALGRAVTISADVLFFIIATVIRTNFHIDRQEKA